MRPVRISIPEPPVWIANENMGAYYMAYLRQTQPPWPSHPHGQMSEANRSAQMCGSHQAYVDGWEWTFGERLVGEALHQVLLNIREIENTMSGALAAARVAFFDRLDEPMQADRGPDYFDLWPGGIDAVLESFA